MLPPRPPALSTTLVLCTPPAPTRGKNQTPSVALMLPISPNLPPNLLVSRPLPALLYPSTQGRESSAKTIAEQEASRVLPQLSLHHVPSIFRSKIGHLKRGNGKSQRLVARDGREMPISTRCAGRIHGCPE